MKNIFYVVITLVFTVCLYSCRHCDSTFPSDRLVVKWFVKPGSYWVYSSSLNQVSDSQYVCLSVYKPRGAWLHSTDGCITYGDAYYMDQVSYRNGLFYDTIHSQANPAWVYISDSKGYILSGSLAYASSMDSISYQNFVVGGHVFQTVYKISRDRFTIAGNDTVSTDLYYAPGYGIVKRVDHWPAGAVSWDLARYHIVQ